MKYDNEEITQLVKKLNEFYVFTLQSVRYILNNTDVDKVTWCTKNSACASGENDPESFANVLHSSGRKLFSTNHRVFGNFVLTGKRGFDILKKVGRPRFVFNGRQGTLDALMIVQYLPSMAENRFIVSAYEPIDFHDDEDYETYYNLSKSDKNYFQNMDAMIVGEIVDCESQN